jgi:hypothetical protein
MGFGTWTEFGAGKVIVGLDSADALFDTLEETGGSKNAIVVSHIHTATSAVTDPTHNHAAGAGSGFMGVPNNGQSGRTDGNQATTFSNTASSSTGISVATTVASAGSSGTNANVQPFIIVKMWKRTA